MRRIKKSQTNKQKQKTEDLLVKIKSKAKKTSTCVSVLAERLSFSIGSETAPSRSVGRGTKRRNESNKDPLPLPACMNQHQRFDTSPSIGCGTRSDTGEVVDGQGADQSAAGGQHLSRRHLEAENVHLEHGQLVHAHLLLVLFQMSQYVIPPLQISDRVESTGGQQEDENSRAAQTRHTEKASLQRAERSRNRQEPEQLGKNDHSEQSHERIDQRHRLRDVDDHIGGECFTQQMRLRQAADRSGRRNDPEGDVGNSDGRQNDSRSLQRTLGGLAGRDVRIGNRAEEKTGNDGRHNLDQRENE